MKLDKSVIWAWALVVLFLLTGICCFGAAVHSMNTYRHIMENPVTVIANVTKYEIDEHTDSDGHWRKDYDLYMTYTYNGQEYVSKYDTVETQSKAEGAIGKKLEIQINPKNPGESLNEHSQYKLLFLFSLLPFAVSIKMLCSIIRYRKTIEKINH